MRATVPAAAFLVATVANLPLLYLFLHESRESLPLIVFAIGALAMAQAWSAGSLIERRREGYRRKLVALVAVLTFLELPLAWEAIRAYDVMAGPLFRVPRPILSFAAVVTAAGLVAVASFLRWNAQPARADP